MPDRPIPMPVFLSKGHFTPIPVHTLSHSHRSKVLVLITHVQVAKEEAHVQVDRALITKGVLSLEGFLRTVRRAM